MSSIAIFLVLLALLGHSAFWVGFVNRTHAADAPRWLVECLSAGGQLIFVAAPITAAWQWQWSGQSIERWVAEAMKPGPTWIYLVPCWCIAIAATIAWARRQFFTPIPSAVLRNDTVVVNIASQLKKKPIAGLQAQWMARLPGNQALQLAVHERQLKLNRLPTELDGLSLAHLSDLHFTGRITIEYFREVIRQTNALRADMVVLTGDFVDEIELLDWIPDTLGQLSAPLGVYFVLGNHDQFTGQETLIRAALTAAGLIDLGGRWQRIEIAGIEVILAGNELPWLGPAADMENCPPRTFERPQLRVLLSHSPDQFQWARRWDFDLMLAGHTHGGQVRLPLIGPIVSPSWQGVKYAGGTFFSFPTLMHISYGVSSEHPLRINCRPEIAKLVLRHQGERSRT